MVDMIIEVGLQLVFGGLLGFLASILLIIIIAINTPRSLEMREKIHRGIENLFAYDIETDFNGDRTVDSFLPKPRHEMNDREARWFQKYYEKVQQNSHVLQEKKDYATQRIAQLDQQRAAIRSQHQPLYIVAEG